MIALVVGSILSALAFETVMRVHQLARARAERAALASILRNAAIPIAHEVEGAGVDSIGGPDVAALPGSSLTIRAERGFWFVCALALPDTLIVAEPLGSGWSLRTPMPARDSLLLYVPGDSIAPIDAWLPLPLVQGPFAGGCPGGAPGSRFVSALDTVVARRRRIAAPTVVRTFESLGYRVYGSGGTWQLGQEGLSAGATIQPVAGPLSIGAVDFAGLDRAMAPAGPATAVVVRMRVAGFSHREGAVGPGTVIGVADSVDWLIHLRGIR
jgi:hypothetical protein